MVPPKLIVFAGGMELQALGDAELRECGLMRIPIETGPEPTGDLSAHLRY